MVGFSPFLLCGPFIGYNLSVADNETKEESKQLTDSKGRKLRPDGSNYSSDPKERYQELLEDGKIGPEYGKLGGRPRKRRASEEIADMVPDELERIKAAFRDGLDPEKSGIERRIKTGKDLLAIEEKEELRKEREADRGRERSRDFMLQALVERLAGDTPAARELKRRLTQEEEEIIDAEEVQYAELPAP